MRKVGPDGSVQPFSSWVFVALKALTGWTTTYSLLGDRRHSMVNCNRSLDPDTCGLLGVWKTRLLDADDGLPTRHI